MEEQKNKSEMKSIIGIMVLILALFVGVKVMFSAMEKYMPNQWDAQVWDEMETVKGSVLYSLRMIQKDEAEMADISKWLEYAEEQEEDGQVFWLNRQDRGEYVLYLPEQDRVLENADLTVSEEKMADGRVTMVLRARTPEKSEEIDAEEQLFCIKTDSEQWDGQRVKVILDGREQNVVQVNGQGEHLYTVDGAEIE